MANATTATPSSVPGVGARRHSAGHGPVGRSGPERLTGLATRRPQLGVAGVPHLTVTTRAGRGAGATEGSTSWSTGVTPPIHRRRGRDETDDEHDSDSRVVKKGRKSGGPPRGRRQWPAPAEQTEEAYYTNHPDCPARDQVHLTSFPVNFDDRSHLILFGELPGLAGARGQRTEKTANFAHAYKAAYLYFRTEADAANAADGIRSSPRIRAAFPSLRARQVCPEITGVPQYRRRASPHWPDMGLPPAGWPLGASWIAHVGQPIGGAIGGLTVDARHQDMVEVVARTGLYDQKWHCDGIPAPYANQLRQERDLRMWLMDRRRGLAPLSDLYLTMATNEIPVLMRRAYLDRGYLAGRQLPPPHAAEQFSQAGAPRVASPKPRLPLPQAKPPPSNSPTSRADPRGTPPQGAGAGSGAAASAAAIMYDPGFPTGTPPVSPNSIIIDEVQTGSHTAQHARGTKQGPWTEERFQAVLRGWGLQHVDGGQTDEESTGHHCYFVVLREALATKGGTDTAVNIKREIQGELEEAQWVE